MEDRPRDIIGEIRTIVGGLASGGTSQSSRKAYTRQAHNILVTQRPRKNVKMDDQVITFSEDDVRGIHQPHDDALVVTLTIAGFITRRVLIDNGSSTDIIYLPVYQQMKIDKERLRPIDIPLVGFTRDKVRPSGVVSFIIEAAQSSNFDLSPPRSIPHGTRYRGTQRRSGHSKGMLFRLSRTGDKTPDDDDRRGPETHRTHRGVGSGCGWTTKSHTKPRSIGTKMDGRLRESMIKFLKSNSDVFAWTHDDMPNIDPSTICHSVSSGKFFGFMVSQKGIEANPYKIKAMLEMTPPRTVKEFQSLTGRVAALNRFVSRMYLTSPPLLSPSQQGETFSLYLAVSPIAVSSALIREEGGTQLPVYYTSKAFQGAEEKYLAMEKLALALFTVVEEEPSEEKPERKWEVKIDGSSVKGAGGVGVVFKTPKRHLLKHSVRLQYPTTNNEAEYETLLTGLRIAKKLGATTLRVQSNSQLIVGQVNGEYEAKEDRMAKDLNLVRNTIRWFGIPRAFISDNGRQFDNSPFREFCEELGIRNHYSSPGHPQANEQVKVINRFLLKMIKTRLEGEKGLWPEELPNILWAYKMTTRTLTGETLFRLTYGTEAVIPVEIGLTTWRTNHHDESNNDSQLRTNLDLLDEARDQAEAKTRAYQQRMARYYD
uniref:Integrase catalytic domain-containing protein n=1 Tax=Fagus sylvatica TaxID=28930 RepID=A0A2N9F0D0_FAGSY